MKLYNEANQPFGKKNSKSEELPQLFFENRYFWLYRLDFLDIE